MPGVSQVSLQRKPAGNLVVLVEQFDLRDASQVEGPDRAMQRRTPDHIPASPAEQQPIWTELGADQFALAYTLVFDAHRAPLGKRLEKLLVDRRAAGQRIGRRGLDLHRTGHPLQLLAQMGRQTRLQFQRRPMRRFQERQCPAVAQLVAQHNQGECLVGREIRRRQEIGAGNAIALVLFVEDQRHARLLEHIQIAKDGAPADPALLGQSLNVVAVASL